MQLAFIFVAAAMTQSWTSLVAAAPIPIGDLVMPDPSRPLLTIHAPESKDKTRRKEDQKTWDDGAQQDQRILHIYGGPSKLFLSLAKLAPGDSNKTTQPKFITTGGPGKFTSPEDGSKHKAPPGFVTVKLSDLKSFNSEQDPGWLLGLGPQTRLSFGTAAQREADYSKSQLLTRRTSAIV